MPVIGVMTAESHAAVQSSRSRRIGLLATEATVQSGSYQRMIAAHDAGAEVTAVACPLLAPAIQRGRKRMRAARMRCLSLLPDCTWGAAARIPPSRLSTSTL